MIIQYKSDKNYNYQVSMKLNIIIKFYLNRTKTVIINYVRDLT